MAITCNRCGFKSPKGAMYCPKCGNQIVSSDTIHALHREERSARVGKTISFLHGLGYFFGFFVIFQSFFLGYITSYYMKYTDEQGFIRSSGPHFNMGVFIPIFIIGLLMVIMRYLCGRILKRRDQSAIIKK